MAGITDVENLSNGLKSMTGAFNSVTIGVKSFGDKVAGAVHSGISWAQEQQDKSEKYVDKVKNEFANLWVDTSQLSGYDEPQVG